LLDDQFSSILPTIKWSRNIFNSIRKFLQLQLTINLVASSMAFLGGVFLGESPLNPMQMLWTNIFIDLMGSISMITEVPANDLLVKKPNNRSEKLMTGDMLRFILTQGFIQIIILSLVLFQGNIMG
jgi:magnesium-transporting ATPase (P-type)